MKFGEYKDLEEANGIKGMKHAHSIRMKQSLQNSADSKEWGLHWMTKGGTLNKMTPPIKHVDEKSARENAKYIQSLNPGKNVKFQLRRGYEDIEVI